MPDTRYLLTLSCANQPGIVAAVTTAIYENGGNIREAQLLDRLPVSGLQAAMAACRCNDVVRRCGL